MYILLGHKLCKLEHKERARNTICIKTVLSEKLTEQCGQHIFKGQCHEIFDLRIFS
jgi:hypothetical protein